MRGSRLLPRLLAAVAGLVLVGGALAAGWAVASDERSLGRVAGAALAGRAGVPVTVERARIAKRRLVLDGVRVGAAGSPFTLTMARLEIDRARSASPLSSVSGATLVAAGAGTLRHAAATEPAGLDALREHVLALAGIDGALRIRVVGAELRGRDAVFQLDLVGEKTAAGAVALALTLAPAGQRPALRIDVRATAATGADVDVRVDVTGEPSRLGAAWPAALPAPPTLATRADVQLLAGGTAAATGRLTLGAEAPAVVDFTARYDGATAEIDVSRWALAQDDRVRLTGTMRVTPAGAGVRLATTARGTVDGARVDGHARYDAGAFDGEVTVEPVSAAALWRRLAMGSPPMDGGARAVRVRITGTSDAHVLSATVDATLDGIEAPGLGEARLDGALDGAVRFRRGDAGLVPGPVERAVLTLTHGGAPVATITARSRGTAPWPLDVDTQVPDAAAVAPLLPQATALVGSGRLAGEVDASDGALRFRGALDAEVASAEVLLGAPAVITALRAAGVPVHWNAGGVEEPGSVSVARLESRGLVVEDVTSSATLIDGLLRLPDLRYQHYGGRGRGWAELALTGPAPPLRARVEGEGLDLAAVVRGTGSTMAQVTGRVGYTGSLQQLHGRGVDAVVQLRSERGGEIGIEAIEGLLASTAVEVESTGLLRQTLENLRVFAYESLDGELRAVDGQGTVDLSIRGRRRLGLFPGPVQAINFRNVPLDVLVSTLDRGTTR